jgi:hypothetical protein
LISWLTPSAWCPKEAHNSKAARSFPRAANGSVCRSNFALVMDAIVPLAPRVGSDLERGLRQPPNVVTFGVTMPSAFWNRFRRVSAA